MNFLDLTPGSTHATNAAVTLYMPPVEAARVLAYLDRYQMLEPELERLRAEVKRLTPDDAHARECKTHQKKALVLLALDNADLLARVLAAIPCHRIGLVRKHLRKHKDRYKIEKPPCYKTVKAILQKHGYL